ncbi:MAG: efflux RND transporter periplasmic adaptor subunit [Chloroflexota bacterium]|nr:MAG: efflux RND transporter periplasmic adaptor subunit [Chloroflexota bacterium]
MKRWLRTLLILLPITCLALCAATVFIVLPQLREARAADSGAVSTAVVERRNLDDVLIASGTLRPERFINLAFEVSGTVQEVNFRVGDSVRMGDVLAQLDTSQLELQLEQARQALIIQEANYANVTKPASERDIAQARAALAQAEANLASAQAAFDNQQNIITQSCANVAAAEDNFRVAQDNYNRYVAEGYQFDVDFRPDMDSPAGKALKQARDQRDAAVAACNAARRAQSSDAAVRAAEAQVAQAKAALEALLAGATEEQRAIAAAQLAQARLNLAQAERNLSKAKLIAPVDGILSAINVSVGQLVGVGGQPAFVLADTSALYVEISVDEVDVERVQVGQQARFTLIGVNSQTPLKGTVERKNTVGDAAQGVVTYGVRIKVTDRVPQLLGMTADVEIILNTRTNVLTVPTRAIRRDPSGRQYVVVQRSDGTSVEIDVQSGLSVGELTEVNGEGLREGQVVLISGTTTRNNGFFGARN